MKSPGTILYENFMEPRRLTQNGLARDLGIPPQRVNEIIKGKRSITIDTALRLGRFFGNSAFFWMDLQTQYDFAQAEESGQVDIINCQVHVPSAVILKRIGVGHGRIDDRNYRIHKAIAKKLEKNPDKIITEARKNIRRWGWDKEKNPPPYMKAWMTLLDEPPSRLVKILTGTGERSILLRSSSPFVGVLTKREKEKAITMEGSGDEAVGS